MNNNRIKTFSNLFQIDNILLNYSPSMKNISQNENSINQRTYPSALSVCSNQAEYFIIKEKKDKNGQNKINLINNNQENSDKANDLKENMGENKEIKVDMDKNKNNILKKEGNMEIIKLIMKILMTLKRIKKKIYL
jgi:hypothetical protein